MMVKNYIESNQLAISQYKKFQYSGCPILISLLDYIQAAWLPLLTQYYTMMSVVFTLSCAASVCMVVGTEESRSTK